MPTKVNIYLWYFQLHHLPVLGSGGMPLAEPGISVLPERSLSCRRRLTAPLCAMAWASRTHRMGAMGSASAPTLVPALLPYIARLAAPEAQPAAAPAGQCKKGRSHQGSSSGGSDCGCCRGQASRHLCYPEGCQGGRQDPQAKEGSSKPRGRQGASRRGGGQRWRGPNAWYGGAHSRAAACLSG